MTDPMILGELIRARLALPAIQAPTESMTAKALRALSPEDVLDNVVEAAPAPASASPNGRRAGCQ